MLASKLNYSKIRNCQKKNKSVYEERDFIPDDLDNYNDLNEKDIPSQPSDPIKSINGQENKTEDLFKVFGDSVNTGNLDYLNELLKSKSSVDENKNRQNLKKKKGHVRHKSNITGLNTKNQIKLSTKQIAEQIPMDASQTPSMRRDLSAENVEVNNQKSVALDSNLVKSRKDEGFVVTSAEPNGISNLLPKSIMNNETPRLVNHGDDNQEKLFDQYFKKNTNKNPAMRRSMSLEDFRQDKEPLGNSNQSASVFTPLEPLNSESRDMLSSTKNSNEIIQKSFMGKIDQFIDYFTKSENSSSQRNLKSQDFYVNTNIKLQKNFQKELVEVHNENKILRHNLEQLESKMSDLILSKKKILHEIKEYKIRDEENKKKIKFLEQSILKQAQKKEEYKYKLFHTQELLAKEKIDNENNLLALKKVLSSKITNTLDNKSNHYKDKGIRDKDKISRDKDQLLNVMYMIKKDKDEVNKTKFKDNRIQENLMLDSRYDQKFLKKIKESGLQYDISSLLSQKIGIASDDEENNTAESINSPLDLDGSYEQETFKGFHKEQEIKYLKDRLIELSDQPPKYSYNNNMFLQEGKNSTRNRSKGKSKNFDYTLGHADIREKQSSLSKIHQKTKIDMRNKFLKEGLMESLSPSDNIEKSFSLHNSD